MELKIQAWFIRFITNMAKSSYKKCKMSKKRQAKGGSHLSTDDKQRHSKLINTKTAVVAQEDNHYRKRDD
jgi:hypothetical protein